MQIQKVGKVGDRYLMLRQSSRSGSATLTVSKIPDKNSKYVDPIIDRVIVYGD